jgi:LysM repeat protein
VVRTVDKLVVAPSSDLDQAIGQEESARAETIAVRRDEEAASRAAEERDDLAKLVSEKETAKTVEKTQPENKPASKQTGKKKPAAKKKTKQHTVVKGETLSGIAARYKVSMSVLRKHNQLKGDIVRVGQKLKIPATN